MPSQGWMQRLMNQKGPGTLLNTYTTAKSVINTDSIFTLPSTFFDYPGKELIIRVAGAISNIVTTPGTIDFQVKFGSIVVWDSGAIQLNATAHTTLPFSLVIPLTAQVIGNGTTAKLMGIGTLAGDMFTKTAAQVDGVNSETIITVPITAPAQGNGFDSTSAQIVDFWAGFSISNAGNGIQVQQYSVDSPN
jgi:hypothetical protein